MDFNAVAMRRGENRQDPTRYEADLEQVDGQHLTLILLDHVQQFALACMKRFGIIGELMGFESDDCELASLEDMEIFRVAQKILDFRSH